MRLSSVVLPAPRKPVSMVTGTILSRPDAIVMLAFAACELQGGAQTARLHQVIPYRAKNRTTCDYSTACREEQTLGPGGLWLGKTLVAQGFALWPSANAGGREGVRPWRGPVRGRRCTGRAARFRGWPGRNRPRPLCGRAGGLAADR